jgi:hypothetical protein
MRGCVGDAAAGHIMLNQIKPGHDMQRLGTPHEQTERTVRYKDAGCLSTTSRTTLCCVNGPTEVLSTGRSSLCMTLCRVTLSHVGLLYSRTMKTSAARNGEVSCVVVPH